MKNLRPLLSVNLVPAISEPVSKVPYDIIKVAKSKILPGRGLCPLSNGIFGGHVDTLRVIAHDHGAQSR